jgi:hypothetical protein
MIHVYIIDRVQLLHHLNPIDKTRLCSFAEININTDTEIRKCCRSEDAEGGAPHRYVGDWFEGRYWLGTGRLNTTNHCHLVHEGEDITWLFTTLF